MKIAGTAACVIAGMSCIDNALGDQTMFSPGFVWLWWLVAFLWFTYAIGFAVSDGQ